MSFSVNTFHHISHNNQHYTETYSVLGLLRNYDLESYPQLIQWKFEIRCITCEYMSCKYHLDLTWNPTLCD